jgi:DNA-binding MarR family transcriptional regulator
MRPNETARAAAPDEIAATVAVFERFMFQISADHRPPFDVHVTIPQLRCLYQIAAAGEVHMSRLVGQLGVSTSTVSGLVDRLVDHGFVVRRDDPDDRRQVVLSLAPEGVEFIDRMRELGNTEFRNLIARLDSDDLRTVRRSIEILARAAAQARGAGSTTAGSS